MAGKRIFSLLLSLVLVFVLAYSCLAQSIRPFYNGSGNVRAIINNSSYSVKAEAVSSVTKITVSGTLYEKGLFGIYGKVDSCSSSSSNQYCTASSLTLSRAEILLGRKIAECRIGFGAGKSKIACVPDAVAAA